MSWYYENKEYSNIENFPKDSWGFVYKITNIIDNRFYIGKKSLWSVRNIKLTKKELLEQALSKKPGRKATKKEVIKESDWKNYYGSEPTLKDDIKKLGKDNFKREIIYIALNKKALTYSEIKYQMIYEVLENENTYNSNIEGRYFKSDFLK